MTLQAVIAVLLLGRSGQVLIVAAGWRVGGNGLQCGVGRVGYLHIAVTHTGHIIVGHSSNACKVHSMCQAKCWSADGPDIALLKGCQLKDSKQMPQSARLMPIRAIYDT